MAAVAGGAGGSGPYGRAGGVASDRVYRGGHGADRGSGGVGGGNVTAEECEGATFAPGPGNRGDLSSEDVIPTPLEIRSPGGSRDILPVTCLSSNRVSFLFSS